MIHVPIHGPLRTGCPADRVYFDMGSRFLVGHGSQTADWSGDEDDGMNVGPQAAGTLLACKPEMKCQNRVLCLAHMLIAGYESYLKFYFMSCAGDNLPMRFPTREPPLPEAPHEQPLVLKSLVHLHISPSGSLRNTVHMLSRGACLCLVDKKCGTNSMD